MPRLQILHHKSYHPYNEKNKQRVREDEAKARAEELQREQIAIDAESQSRLNELRRRAGSPDDNLPSTSSTRDTGDSLLERHRREKAKAEKRERKQRDRLDFDFPSETKRREDRRREGKERARGVDDQDRGREDHDRDRDREGRSEEREDKWTSGGHLNLFADEERESAKEPPPPPTMAELAKKKAEQEMDRFTMYLERPERETKPWYADRDLRRYEDKETTDQAMARRARDRRKDERSKDANDPLNAIKKTLAQTAPKPSRDPKFQTERERALAMIAKKNGKEPRKGWETPDFSWQDDLERQKDTASNRYNSGYDRRRSGGRRWDE